MACFWFPVLLSEMFPELFGMLLELKLGLLSLFWLLLNVGLNDGLTLMVGLTAMAEDGSCFCLSIGCGCWDGWGTVGSENISLESFLCTVPG